MDVGATLVADGKTAEVREPGERSLDDLAVTDEPLTSLDAAQSDPERDAARPALAPATATIVALVGIQLLESAPWATPMADAHARRRIERGGQHAPVVTVGPS